MFNNYRRLYSARYIVLNTLKFKFLDNIHTHKKIPICKRVASFIFIY